MFHTSLTGVLKDATSWLASITAGLVAALVYVPDDYKAYVGIAIAVSTFLGVVLKGSPEAPPVVEAPKEGA